ncbi:MAG: hypothetical protein H6718_33130 [Polyangiaceae bacterium]|nr:hypothetical protein [Myxococcales bacterium]MCB9590301.1 hypothetical protein [Polyangiaceae bacterium]MCB9605044.1 hypothetical protein [Polyangiaceae bacterium]
MTKRTASRSGLLGSLVLSSLLVLTGCGDDGDGGSSGGTGATAGTGGASGGSAGSTNGGNAGSTSGGSAGSTSGGSSSGGGSSSSGGSSGAGATGGSGGNAGAAAGGSAGASSGGSGGATAGAGGSAGAAGSAGSGGTAGAAGANNAGPSSDRHVKRPKGTKYAGNGYWEYLPPNYATQAKHPLMVFWHGVGENGDGGATDLDKVIRNGPPKLIDKDQWPNSRPFIVLSAQHTGNGNCPSANEIHDFITFAIGAYKVDTKRVYLTGLSCGAIGSWNYFGNYIDQQIAAIVVIAGDGRNAWNKAGCDLGKVPIWAFHGDMDPTVKPVGSIEPMTNLQACTSPAPVDAKLTIYPGVKHDSWTRTYDLSAGHDIYSWMLGYTHP